MRNVITVVLVYDQLPGVANPNIGPVAAQTKMMSTATEDCRVSCSARRQLSKMGKEGVVVHGSLLYLYSYKKAGYYSRP